MAINVDFYILEAASGQKSLFFACRLLEKAYAEQQCVYVHTQSREEAERFDTLLWTYRDDSFVPHQLYQGENTFPPPIQIGFDQAPLAQQQILMNLTHQIPPFYMQFKRVIEIVFNDPPVQQLARERYRQYRDQGCEMNMHKMKGEE